MKVLVTGGGGRLGSGVVRHLTGVADGSMRVRATDARVRRDLPVPVEPGDLRDPMAVYRLVEGCDAVVHLGNYPDMVRGMLPQVLFQENATMNANVFQAAVDQGVTRIVFASSIQAMSGDRLGRHVAAGPEHRRSHLPYLPLDGEVAARPGNAYGLSKQAGESYLQMLERQDPGLSLTAIRFPFLAEADRLRAYLERRCGSQDRAASDVLFQDMRVDEGFTYLSMEDACGLVEAVLRRAGCGYRTLLPANPQNTLGWPIPKIIETFYEGVPLRAEAGAIPSLVDVSGIERELGWRPTTLLPASASR